MTTPVPAFPVPSFPDLQTQIAADLAGVPGLDKTLRVGVVPVMNLLLSKLNAGEYAYLAGLVNRALIPTLMQAPYLDAFCAGVGLTRKGAATAAGNVIFSGAPGIPISAGTQMQDSTGTNIFEVSTTVEIASGQTTVSVPVAAITGGAAGNLAADAPMTLLTAIAGINAIGYVDGNGLSGGFDQETDAQLQERLGERLGSTPQGGAASDFVAWAKQVAGVTRAWVYPLQNGPGTVSVAFMMDGRPDPVPLAADVTDVQAVLDNPAIVPVVGTYSAVALSALAQAVTVAGLAVQPGYTLATVQANIAIAIAALNYTTTPGGYGWDGALQNYATGGTLYLEQVSGAISNAAGVKSFDLTAPTADMTAPFGQIMQLDAPSFT